MNWVLAMMGEQPNQKNHDGDDGNCSAVERWFRYFRAFLPVSFSRDQFDVMRVVCAATRKRVVMVVLVISQTEFLASVRWIAVELVKQFRLCQSLAFGWDMARPSSFVENYQDCRSDEKKKNYFILIHWFLALAALLLQRGQKHQGERERSQFHKFSLAGAA